MKLKLDRLMSNCLMSNCLILRGASDGTVPVSGSLILKGVMGYGYGYGLWFMVYGMVYGLWRLWFMANIKFHEHPKSAKIC